MGVLVSLCCYLIFRYSSQRKQLLFQFLCVVTYVCKRSQRDYDKVLVSLCCYITTLLGIYHGKKLFQFLCVVTFQFSELYSNYIQFQFLCVVTGKKMYYNILLYRFSFFVLLPTPAGLEGVPGTGFSFFVLLHFSVSTGVILLGVLVSLCCYNFPSLQFSLSIRFQFLCVVT